MNIKEAGHYAKVLENIGYQLSRNLNHGDFLYKVVEKHLRSAATIDADNEEIEVVPTRDLPKCTVEDMAFLVQDVINEKLRLAVAIDKAKQALVIDWTENGEKLTLDSAIEYNKKLREYSSQLSFTLSCKSDERKKQGTGRKFNVEGNQTVYYYDIEEKRTINFDRNVLNAIYKKTLKKTDEISKLIDNAQLKDVVNFEPKYDVHDSVEEIIEKYIASKG